MLPNERMKLGANGGMPTELVRLRVRCSGKRHVVLYKPHGPQRPGRPPRRGGVLIFKAHSHKELQRELNLVELGSEPCGCVRVLLAWRKAVACGRPARLPASLRGAAQDAYSRHSHRLHARDKGNDMLAIDLHERPSFLGPLIFRLIQQRCGLPSGLTHSMSRGPSEYYLDLWDHGTLFTTIPISLRWYKEIYLTRKHFHNNQLVVKALPKRLVLGRFFKDDPWFLFCWPNWDDDGSLLGYPKIVEVPGPRWGGTG